MIEIVYNKEKEDVTGNEEYFCIPRNIRQMGETSAKSRIYIEDYPYTYLKSVDEGEKEKGQAAILLGKGNWKDGLFYIFAKSAIFMEGLEISGEHIPLNDTVWGKLYEEAKQYFPGQEVVGWYLNLPGNGMKITDAIYRTHLNHFGGNEKVLFLADEEEREEGFFLYENGKLERQTGFYIYYERNDTMQEYMQEKRPKLSIDAVGKVHDRAVKDFRKIIARKNEEKETNQVSGVLSAVSVGIVALALALGVTFVGGRIRSETSGQENLLAEFLGDEDNKTVETQSKASADKDADLEAVDDSAKAGESDADAADDQIADASNSENSINKETETGQDVGNQAENSAEQTDAGDSLLTPTPVEEVQEQMDGQQLGGENQINEGDAPSAAGETSAEPAGADLGSPYTIREGDTISKISMRYYGDLSQVNEICKRNNLTQEDIIYPGQTILLP